AVESEGLPGLLPTGNGDFSIAERRSDPERRLFSVRACCMCWGGPLNGWDLQALLEREGAAEQPFRASGPCTSICARVIERFGIAIRRSSQRLLLSPPP